MTKAFLSALLSFLIAIGAYAQNITVHGTVLSKTDDEPLIGVSVKTSEGNLGVATDIEVYAEGLFTSNNSTHGHSQKTVRTEYATLRLTN
jgi:hypothetical protein